MDNDLRGHFRERFAIRRSAVGVEDHDQRIWVRMRDRRRQCDCVQTGSCCQRLQQECGPTGARHVRLNANGERPRLCWIVGGSGHDQLIDRNVADVRQGHADRVDVTTAHLLFSRVGVNQQLRRRDRQRADLRVRDLDWYVCGKVLCTCGHRESQR